MNVHISGILARVRTSVKCTCEEIQNVRIGGASPVSYMNNLTREITIDNLTFFKII